jgi:extradiol dioxygenase family protein
MFPDAIADPKDQEESADARLLNPLEAFDLENALFVERGWRPSAPRSRRVSERVLPPTSRRLRSEGGQRRRLGMERPRFHLAFPVSSLVEARAFYGDLLGCPEGRSADDWVDFDLHGHQIVAHLAPAESQAVGVNAVDGEAVPVRHFGLILAPADWRALASRLKAAGVRFLIEPRTRFAGQAGEQSAMFVLDPSGNALEFKAFADEAMIFATDEGLAKAGT